MFLQRDKDNYQLIMPHLTGAVMSLLAVLTAEDNEAVEAAIVLSAYVPIPSRLNEVSSTMDSCTRLPSWLMPSIA